MAWCSENEACSSILDFLHRLNNRAGSAHENKFAIVYSGLYTRSVSGSECTGRHAVGQLVCFKHSSTHSVLLLYLQPTTFSTAKPLHGVLLLYLHPSTFPTSKPLHSVLLLYLQPSTFPTSKFYLQPSTFPTSKFYLQPSTFPTSKPLPMSLYSTSNPKLFQPRNLPHCPSIPAEFSTSEKGWRVCIIMAR